MEGGCCGVVSKSVAARAGVGLILVGLGHGHVLVKIVLTAAPGHERLANTCAWPKTGVRRVGLL